ncbi:serine protease [Paenibacillus sp. GYB004]|uniref:S1C family serine protease n=1 Tax=Paenibacillus sp. GYB004 TaxID=2994393 RepID=UPI002F96820E
MKEREQRTQVDIDREETGKEEEPVWEEPDFFDTDEDEADEAEERAYFERKARARQRLKKWIAVTAIAAMLGNVVAFWPMLYNMQAIQFLAISRKLSQDDSIARYKQSVVVVGTEDGKGTGFVISPDGYIVTNHHVIDGNQKAFVRFSEGASHEAEVVISEETLDLAVLKIVTPESELPALPLERESQWRPGNPVYVIGNPLFFNHIANQGTIVGEIPVQGLDVKAMALRAPIYKGNSGSPVINENGEVIGVVFATTQVELGGEKEKMGLAVPIRHLIPLLEKQSGGQ